MTRDQSGNVTDLLEQFRGDQQADAALVALVYDELHRLASRYMRKERSNHTLQPTALVHEAYLRLAAQRAKAWKNRSHFFAVAAIVMRQILVDSARRRNATKRGDGKIPLNVDALDDRSLAPLTLDSGQAEDVIAIDESLAELAKINARRSRIVELRVFSGMTRKEIAEALDISERTAEREWAVAQTWLYERLRTRA
jgi:RNA polymerase sigma factor (TIGR02999 family)